MVDLPDASVFAAAIADRRFVVAAVIAAVSGAARGFAGFGSALLYVPLISAIYEPRVAAVTILLIDFASGAPFAVPAWPRCHPRDVLPMTLAAALAVPLGTMILLVADPVWLRWFISAFVLSAIPVLTGGWRYHGQPKLPVTLAVGAVAGLTGGAVQIAGPPVILYWLGGAIETAVARANMIVFFALLGAVLCVSYVIEGLFTADTIALAILLGIPYTLAMIAGARSFHRSSNGLYRRIAYAIMAFAALASLPIFDRFFR
jgi:uncharacterized membrane protein YfcA